MIFIVVFFNKFERIGVTDIAECLDSLVHYDGLVPIFLIDHFLQEFLNFSIVLFTQIHLAKDITYLILEQLGLWLSVKRPYECINGISALKLTNTEEAIDSFGNRR